MKHIEVSMMGHIKDAVWAGKPKKWWFSKILILTRKERPSVLAMATSLVRKPPDALRYQLI